MHYFINQQFANLSQQTKMVASNMQTYLNDYKNKPVNPEHSDRKEKEIFARQKQINTILAFVITAEKSVNELIELLENEYKRGFIAGQEKERKQHKPNILDKEALRGYHNINQINKWADHF